MRKPTAFDALTGFATSPGPGTVRVERVYRAPAGRLWDHVTVPDRRREWWAAGEMELRKGGRVDLTWYFDELSPFEEIPPRYATHGAGHTQAGRITRFEQGRQIAFTWSEDSEVTFEIESRGDSAALVVTHRRLEGRPDMIRVATGWFTHMLLLEDVLLGRERRPFWHHFALAQAEHERRLGEPPIVIHVSRRMKARADRVFDAWLDPANAPLWMFADDDARPIRAEADPRPGGAFVFAARPEGRLFEHHGTYVEIERPRRLVFTFGVPDISPELDRVTVELAPAGGGCMVEVVHEMRPVWADYSDRAETGWLRILGRIAAKLKG